jgi:hypothetical protein
VTTNPEDDKRRPDDDFVSTEELVRRQGMADSASRSIRLNEFGE